MRGQPGFSDVDERLKDLTAKGDALERLSRIIDFELFRGDLARAVPRSDGSKGGRPPFDLVFMFKVLILQASHSLSDERTEFLIKDRLSGRAFPRARAVRSGAGRQHHLDLPRGAHPRRDCAEARHRSAVLGLRHSPAGRRLPGDGWADRRRDRGGRTQAAQYASR